MAEKLDDNLEEVENLQSLAHRLHGELDKYRRVEDFVKKTLSVSGGASRLAAEIYEGWDDIGVKNPPRYVPMSKLPTTNAIDNQQNSTELENYITILFNALRFLRLINGGWTNEPPVSERQIKIIGGTRCRFHQIVELYANIRNINTGVLPFEVSCIGNKEELFPRAFNLECLEILDTIVKTRIAVIVQNAGFEFDEEKMVINLD